MTDVRTEVTLSGPIFDGSAVQAVEEFTTAAVGAIAERGVDLVRNELGQVLQNPTGYYESQVQETRVASDRLIVSDGGVVYGPWLAGESSRNQTTSFPGYDHWREATQALDAAADQVALQELPPFLAAMNG